MTISQTLKLAISKLGSVKIDFPHLEAEILLSAILKKPREFLPAHEEKILTAKQLSGFEHQLTKRLKGLPIAYLTGHKEFYGLDFMVNKSVLIPRPETELMVDEAAKLATQSTRSLTLVDLGTGSGCIIITLAKMLNQKFIAVDISSEALIVAKKNARLHGVDKKIKFIKSDLLSPVVLTSPLIILANLPYLTPSQIKESPSIKYEPKLALTAGPDGLKYYRKLFKQIKKFHDITVLCEIDPGQKTPIKQLTEQYLPHAKIQIKKDLAGLNRLAIINI